MKTISLIFIAQLFFSVICAQNVGVGIIDPTEKLDVDGRVRADGLVVNDNGSQYDFLMKNDAGGTVGFKKGHGAQAIHYIIAVDGFYPNDEGGNNYDVTLIGEIKLFAGMILPSGWMYCHGQVLNIGSYATLYSLLGNAYGGNGTSTFALPDLRGAAPVSAGTSGGGYTWALGQKTN